MKSVGLLKFSINRSWYCNRASFVWLVTVEKPLSQGRHGASLHEELCGQYENLNTLRILDPQEQTFIFVSLKFRHSQASTTQRT
jgi:hypothetical protein